MRARMRSIGAGDVASLRPAIGRSRRCCRPLGRVAYASGLWPQTLLGARGRQGLTALRLHDLGGDDVVMLTVQASDVLFYYLLVGCLIILMIQQAAA